MLNVEYLNEIVKEKGNILYAIVRATLRDWKETDYTKSQSHSKGLYFLTSDQHIFHFALYLSSKVGDQHTTDSTIMIYYYV